MIDGLARGEFTSRELVDAHLDRIHSLDARGCTRSPRCFDDEARAQATRSTTSARRVAFAARSTACPSA
jgi:hypothetical protein